MQHSVIQKYVTDQNSNLLLSYYNLPNINKNPILKNLQLILRFNLETKSLKKISYEMFLSFFFLMFLYANQLPTFSRLKQRDNLYVHKLSVNVKPKNIFNTLSQLLYQILTTVREDKSLKFRTINENELNLFLRKINIFLHIEHFPVLQEFLKYELDLLNFNVAFSFNKDKNNIKTNNLHANYLRLLQIPVNRNNFN